MTMTLKSNYCGSVGNMSKLFNAKSGWKYVAISLFHECSNSTNSGWTRGQEKLITAGN